MKKILKNFFNRIFWYIGKSLRIHAINKSLLEINYSRIVNEKKYQNEKHLINFGFKVYSQSDEDGILQEIFSRIGIKKKTFVELGIQNGKECNTTYLLVSGWSGLWIDKETKDLEIQKIFKTYYGKQIKYLNRNVDKENVNNLISSNFTEKEEIDLLSIDIGLSTFHVLKEINIVNPRVVVTEYNSKFRASGEWVSEYNSKGQWDKSDYFGASLKSFELMMKNKNYLLVACNVTGVNAFFVRKDLINEKFIQNFSSEFNYEPPRYWLVKKFESENKVVIGKNLSL